MSAGLAMNLTETESFLYTLPRFTDDTRKAYKPGFERIEHLLDAMDDPQDSFGIVHIAGTNGKGSTASMIAAIGTASGRRIGLHTSPHIFHVSERMRIDGSPVPASWLADAVTRYRPVAEEIRPSFFEFTVALSMRYFAEEAVDLAVVEVGMGGRLDATNVLAPVLSVITDIGLDHTEFLGTTIEDVATEKAGIIKDRVPVVTSARPAAAHVIAEIAGRKMAPVHLVMEQVELVVETADVLGSVVTARTPLRSYDSLFLGLAGRHQLSNAAVALRAAELVYDEVRSEAVPVFQGLRHVRQLSGLRGRLEVLRNHPLIVADVAHNADGVSAALDHLQEMRDMTGTLCVLLGVMRDKDVDAIAQRLVEAGARVRPVEVPSSRAMDPAELASRLRGWQIKTDRPCTVEIGVREFVASANRSDALLISGSHLVVAQLEGRTQ